MLADFLQADEDLRLLASSVVLGRGDTIVPLCEIGSLCIGEREHTAGKDTC